jgi:hypothetical protein
VKLKAKEVFEYPLKALRELIANAFVHRDYQDETRIIHIKIFSDRIEIINPGTWQEYINNWTGESITVDRLISESVNRNQRLASLVAYIKLFEGEGSGLAKTKEECEEVGAKIPEIKVKTGFVTATIFPLKSFKYFQGEPSVRLYLSAVSDEFGIYRDTVRRAMTRPHVEVKIQEDFKALSGDTLWMLENYIDQCEAVIHFAGEMAGSTPALRSVEDLLARRPGLEAKLAKKGIARESLASLTYTQWEAWLAICFGKGLLIVAPAQGADRGPAFMPTEASRASQADHLKRLRAINHYPGPPFRSADNLVAQIFGSAVIDALVKAKAIAPLRKPRNLPFASLGTLFMGRDADIDALRVALSAGKEAAVVVRALHGLGEAATWRRDSGERRDSLLRLSSTGGQDCGLDRPAGCVRRRSASHDSSC